MNPDQLEAVLIEVVANIQQISGRPAVRVGPETKPLNDMPGFDSLNGVESTIELCGRIKRDVPFNNVFVDEQRALTIRQAAKRLSAYINAGKH